MRSWAHSLASPRDVEGWRVGVSVRRAGEWGMGKEGRGNSEKTGKTAEVEGGTLREERRRPRARARAQGRMRTGVRARAQACVPRRCRARLCTCAPRPARAAKLFRQARILSARLQPTLSRGAYCVSCPARSVVTRSLIGNCVLSVWPYESVVARAVSRRLGVHTSAVELAVETTRVV